MLLHLPVVEGCAGVDEFLIFRVEFFKCLSSQLPVPRHLRGYEPAAGELNLFPVRALHGREFQIRIIEHAETLRRRFRHVTGRGQQFFHFFRERVVAKAYNLAYCHAVFLKPRLCLVVGGQLIIRELQDFRLEIGYLLRDLHAGALSALDKDLMCLIGSILIMQKVRVVNNRVEFYHAGFIEVHYGKQALRVRSRAPFESGDLLRQVEALLKVFFPCVCRRVNV